MLQKRRGFSLQHVYLARLFSSPLTDRSKMSTVPQDAESEAENQRLITEEASIRVCRRRWTRHLRAVGRWTRSNLLLVATFLSVVVGIILGLSIHQADPGRAWIAVLSLPGELFLRMLKMLILPLIIFSLMAGLGSLDTKVAGSLGWRTVAYYLTTTVVAAVLGLALVMIIRPGERWRVEKPCDNSSLSVGGHNLETLDSVLDLLRNLFPDNLIVAMFQQTQTVYTEETVTSWSKCLAQNNETFTNCSAAVETVESLDLDCSNATRTERQVGLGNREGTNVLGIIVFTVVFSVFLSRQGERGRPVVEAIATLNEVIMSIVRLVMWFSPVGIASIIMGELLEVEDFVALVQQIGLYMVTVLLGLFIHGCITLPLLFMVLTRSNPLKLMRHTAQALLTAFGTSSSSAALPVTIQCLEEKAGVDSRVTRFMLPVGATINMDGTALYEAVAVVFIAQVEGINTDFATILIICITATAASIGAATVPSAGLVTMVIVLVAVDLPPENIALLLPVDWLLDRFRTTVNVAGDCFGAGIVNHYSKKKLASAAPNHPPPSPPTPRGADTKLSGYTGESGPAFPQVRGTAVGQEDDCTARGKNFTETDSLHTSSPEHARDTRL